MNEELIQKLKSTFADKYGYETGDVFFAPGRVNLIGEHTDYNGGHVFPCAISMGIYGLIEPREDDTLRFYSLNIPEKGVIEVSLSDLKAGRTDLWTKYAEGVFWTYMRKGYNFSHGADIMYAGDVPFGSGLSSSASLEVLTAIMVRSLYGIEDVTDIDIALYAQYAENEYCGMHCGIMDQVASVMGRKSCAIFLNTNDLSHQIVPLKLGDYELIITNSNVKHSLVSSAYNDRRRECKDALEKLRNEPSLAYIENLCDIDDEIFNRFEYLIDNEVVRRRAKHAVLEDGRTKSAVEALAESNIGLFGKLMNESHSSLKDDYEVSCKELDFLAERARKLNGVLGSRMTGGGFGGCTVSIVKKSDAEDFIDTLSKEYFDEFGIKADFYRVMPGEGARKIL